MTRKERYAADPEYRGRHVSGLHVETNLQVIPASINKLKANRFAVA